MDAEEKALVKALLDKDAIVAGGVLYCAPVMLRAAAALTAALEDREDAERYRWLKRNCQYGFEDHDGPQLIHRNGETGPHQNTKWREQLDAAIDARRSHD